MPAFGGRLRYLFEKNQGKSWALNSGIAATSGDLLGIIDDDEEDPLQLVRLLLFRIRRSNR